MRSPRPLRCVVFTMDSCTVLSVQGGLLGRLEEELRPPPIYGTIPSVLIAGLRLLSRVICGSNKGCPGIKRLGLMGMLEIYGLNLLPRVLIRSTKGCRRLDSSDATRLV